MVTEYIHSAKFKTDGKFSCKILSTRTQMWQEYNSGTCCEIDSANYLLNRKSATVKIFSFF